MSNSNSRPNEKAAKLSFQKHAESSRCVCLMLYICSQMTLSYLSSSSFRDKAKLSCGRGELQTHSPCPSVSSDLFSFKTHAHTRQHAHDDSAECTAAAPCVVVCVCLFVCRAPAVVPLLSAHQRNINIIYPNINARMTRYVHVLCMVRGIYVSISCADRLPVMYVCILLPNHDDIRYCCVVPDISITLH